MRALRIGTGVGSWMSSITVPTSGTLGIGKDVRVGTLLLATLGLDRDSSRTMHRLHSLLLWDNGRTL